MYIEPLHIFWPETKNQKFSLSTCQKLEKHVKFFQNIYFWKNDECLKEKVKF